MLRTNADLESRMGLSVQGGRATGSTTLLTGAAADPAGAQLVSLTSETNRDAKGNITASAIRYWRHQPFGESLEQNLIRIEMAPAEGRNSQPQYDKIWFQSQKVFDRHEHDVQDPVVMKRINRVIEAAGRLNTLLREKGPVENASKIIHDCRIPEVTGEDVVMRGLSREGGFDFKLSSYFLQMAEGSGKKPLRFKNITLDQFKTIHGFRINTLEPDKNFDSTRKVLAADPESGIEYGAGVEIRHSPTKVTVRSFVQPGHTPDGMNIQAIPEWTKLVYRREGDDFILEQSVFADEKEDTRNIFETLATIGLTQDANRDLADWRYPSFLDSAAKRNKLEKISPLPKPPSLEREGGEFLYFSLHGCSFEKRIENFGDQIGIAAVTLHRGLKKDGTTSAVGVAVDLPFAAGGPDSNYDGAIPDYLQFWDDIKYFLITHDHYDHKGGLAMYAAKGLMRDKIVACTGQVKYMIEQDLENLEVPRNLRPKFHVIEGEGAFPVSDNDGNLRCWVQYHANATDHSALCTPYIVTGCYNDKFYNGSLLVYGDSRGLKKSAEDFFRLGTRLLPEQAKRSGKTVTPSKVDRDITVALHDITAIVNDGKSPTQEEVEEVTDIVFGWCKDKNIVMAPISTNNSEYTAGINAAHRAGRNITGVGANAERRLSCMNLFGVNPDINLRNVRLDPLEEIAKAPDDRLIPQEILDQYFQAVLGAGEKPDPADAEATEEYERKLVRLHRKNCREFMETLPPDERDHEASTAAYMADSLAKYGAVVFENDINGYLMARAISDRRKTASLRATRGSELGRGWRSTPGQLLVFTTGTQGNHEEKFSTLQKFVDGNSLLDIDEVYRSTGYRIDEKNYVFVISQPAIVGNQEAQDSLVHGLVSKRDVTVIQPFLNGFTVHNPKDLKKKILADLKQRGWKHEEDGQGGIHVYGHSLHKHGHGFRNDLKEIMSKIKAVLHEPHHIPSRDAYFSAFRDILAETGDHHSGITPDDFQAYRIDARQEDRADAYKVVAHLRPSYILVRMVRKFGQFYGGTLELLRKSLLRPDGQNREDGLGVRPSADDFYNQQIGAQLPWQDDKARKVSKAFKTGASIVNTQLREKQPLSRQFLNTDLAKAALDRVAAHQAGHP